MFTIAPPALFLIAHRFSYHTTGRRERNSVYGTNLALLGVLVVAALTIGLKAFVLIQLPIVVLASMAGVWMFYVQHQFENTYYEQHANWSFKAAALEGSSFYKLPKLLQWFTGNIGFHHVHHLCPRIPNYNLEKCHTENELFNSVEPMTLLSSLRSMAMRLWHPDKRIMVGFMSDITFADFR
jgi:omega-6 fatty acid desaturase (delta-12 desaturase)